MESIREVKVFLSKPDGLMEEEKVFFKVIEIINKVICHFYSLKLVGKTFKKDTYSSIGSSVQNVIYNQIGEYEIYVGMLWKRIGNGYTLVEFEDTVKKYKEDKNSVQICFFFKEPGDIDNNKEYEEYGKVLNFKKDLEDNQIQYGVLYNKFKTLNEFEDKLNSCLAGFTKRIVEIVGFDNLYKKSSEEILKVANDEMDIILNNLYQFGQVILEESHKTSLKFEKILKSFRNSNKDEKQTEKFFKKILKIHREYVFKLQPSAKEYFDNLISGSNTYYFILHTLQKSPEEERYAINKIIKISIDNILKSLIDTKNLVLDYKKSILFIEKAINKDTLSKPIIDFLKEIINKIEMAIPNFNKSKNIIESNEL